GSFFIVPLGLTQVRTSNLEPRTSRTVRLACVKHAASVRPEPGSNSPYILYTKSLIFTLVCCFLELLAFDELLASQTLFSFQGTFQVAPSRQDLRYITFADFSSTGNFWWERGLFAAPLPPLLLFFVAAAAATLTNISLFLTLCNM
ncbi:hypothetical protein SAMN05660706_14816, partial [Desulfoscipio geothermicus DSM 3669]